MFISYLLSNPLLSCLFGGIVVCVVLWVLLKVADIRWDIDAILVLFIIVGVVAAFVVAAA